MLHLTLMFVWLTAARVEQQHSVVGAPLHLDLHNQRLITTITC